MTAVEMEVDSDAVYGIWSDCDESSGNAIQDYFHKNSNLKLVKINVTQSLLDISRNSQNRYLVLLSGHLLNDHVILVYLTQVLHCLYRNQQLTLTIVNIDSDLKGEKIPSNLQALNIITAPELQKEDQLHDILQSLLHVKTIKEVLPIGNVGVGLAWSYFYGYLNLILPGLKERIRKSTFFEENGKRIFKKFFILLPRSCHAPAKFEDVDSRFASAGPLDDGRKKSRAGQPERLYHNFVQKMKGKDGKDYFFCGEFATPLLAMQKMLEDPMCEMDEEELDKQMVLFKHTLMAILNHENNPACKDLTYILDYDDLNFALYDEIFRIVYEDVQLNVKTPASSLSSFVTLDRAAIVCYDHDDDKKMKEDLEEFLMEIRCTTFSSVSKLLEYEPECAEDQFMKIFVIVSEKSKDEINLNTKKLIAARNVFQKITFILTFAPDVAIPDWLEETGADYIHERRDKEFWKRIMGSLWGTSAEGDVAEEKEWTALKGGGGVQYQVDRLPVGNVAEGLAWSYYHNYLTLIASSIPERICKSEHFGKGKMAKKMLILLPYSCFSYPTLEEADPAITSVGNLEPLVIELAGNARTYNTGICKIELDGQEYYACVEYCTPVLVMYEMEAEGKAGLNKLQKEAQLAFFYETLKAILQSPRAKECKDAFHLLYYDDRETTLSEIIVAEIKKIN